jgi:hypothetical protein
LGLTKIIFSSGKMARGTKNGDAIVIPFTTTLEHRKCIMIFEFATPTNITATTAYIMIRMYNNSIKQNEWFCNGRQQAIIPLKNSWEGNFSMAVLSDSVYPNINYDFMFYNVTGQQLNSDYDTRVQVTIISIKN